MKILGLGCDVGHEPATAFIANDELIEEEEERFIRDEPMVCSPTDALNMLYGSDLQFLTMKNMLVKKPDSPIY